jgi:CHAT domain-containing protein/tetratricopeptide (TPR) repeat protein
MRVIFISIITIFFVALALSQSIVQKEKKYIQDYTIADKLFHEAEKLSGNENYDEVLEEKLNNQSLNIFQNIIPVAKKAGNDSLAFLCYLKTGILLHYFDSITLAKSNYLSAIALKTVLPQIEDSLLFQPLLFTGRICYGLNKFDSAYYYYKAAEKIREKYKTTLNEEQRLYNGLGSMYFETGNFKKAKNYFEKAILILSPTEPAYKDLLITYKINIASSLVKLEKFKEADSIYTSLLQYKITTNEILQSMGFVNLNLGKAEIAIEYFKKIDHKNSSNILLYNQLGKAFLSLGKIDSAEIYYSKAISENEKWNSSKRNTLHGLTFQYLADKFIVQKKYMGAIDNYQKSILQFYPDYDESNIYKNPQQFSGIFSYINLFNTLTAKADAFEKLYEQDKKQTLLDAALDAYRSAFLLADYVEKTYDSDEARLFLNKIKYKVHDRPIDISIQLFELTKNKNYLEEAYNFDQKNKASILSLNVQESAIKNQSSFNVDLFEKETSIKTNITRLSLKAAQINDSSQLQKIKNEIRDYEIELGKLQDKIDELPGYKAKKFANSIPSVIQVQKLLSKKTALLSYHLAKNEMVILCITPTELSYTKQVIDSTFFNTVKSLKTSLNNYKGEEKYDGSAMSIQLYNTIIKPVLNKLKNTNNLLIIPDDELNNLPFETLCDEKENFVLSKFNVQYQYSTAFLRDNIKSNTTNITTLAMAPFASMGNDEFPKLLYSRNEIENLQGNILMDSSASKKNFLALAEKAGILHLATHTIVDDSITEKSLIAFYPFKGLPSSENNLYLQEIYNLKLNTTKLVILSACETGTGQLAKGEGLMSLTRAFTYAGCPNIIGSLWKADDKSTAWIMQRFYKYYNDGIDAAASLQKAKLDYIQSPEIERRFKSPNYWAHLVLTGVPEHKTNMRVWLCVVSILAISVILIMYIIKIKNGR